MYNIGIIALQKIISFTSKHNEKNRPIYVSFSPWNIQMLQLLWHAQHALGYVHGRSGQALLGGHDPVEERLLL